MSSAKRAKLMPPSQPTPPPYDEFVSSISIKSGQQIKDEAYARNDAKNLDGLQRLLRAIYDEIKKREGKDCDELNAIRPIVDEYFEQLSKKQVEANATVAVSDRVASITIGLKEAFRHLFDLTAFAVCVNALFKWFDTTKEKNKSEYLHYMAPYVPLIQSSGTGKTRLFVGLRDECNDPETKLDFACKTILCLKHDTGKITDASTYFDKTHRLLKIPHLLQESPSGETDDEKKKTEEVEYVKKQEMNNIIALLNGLLAKSSKDKVVFLFDEAQNWLGNDGFAFRCVRWWLRRKHLKTVANETVTMKVVAVFAGTTSSLANFYVDTTSSGLTRDPAIICFNWPLEKEPTKLYPPFFQICTTGCYHRELTADKNLTEFEMAAFCGRPLFAYLQKEGKLLEKEQIERTANGVLTISNSTLHAILKRLLVNKPDWLTNRASHCSVLGSRVQMGITTSFVLSAELVSHAYAHLVDFHPDGNGDITKAVARIAFMPEPVCASLAMGLMQENWALATAQGSHKFTGQKKEFWSQKAMELLTSGLCLPEKGNPGEIMVALYMLFCGDVLRYRQNGTLRKFSVPLGEWFLIMKYPDDKERNVGPMPYSSDSEKLASSVEEVGGINESSTIMEVSFIQVCRNYFRAKSWTTTKGLEWMYKSATASYVYTDCQAIDLVAAVRVKKPEVSYHPLLVSVKCYMQFFPGDVKKAIGKMKDLLAEVRKRKGKKSQESPQKCPTALCLLVLIGADKEANLPASNDGIDNSDLSGFPESDTFRVVSVPENDPFAISNAVNKMTSAYAMTEIFSSHGFVYGEDESNAAKVLRARPRQQESKFTQDLFDGLLSAPQKVAPYATGLKSDS